MTFGPFADRWVTGRMAERDQDRSAVLEDLIFGEIDRGGRRLSADQVNDLAGHANAVSLLLADLRLRLRNPDDVRALADAAAAIGQINRVLHGPTVGR